MGRTACTEPQYLYKGALYLFYIQHVLQFLARKYTYKTKLITHFAVCAVPEVFLRQAEVPFLRPGYGRLLCKNHDRSTQYLKQKGIKNVNIKRMEYTHVIKNILGLRFQITPIQELDSNISTLF
jgi:hypothetical protein